MWFATLVTLADGLSKVGFVRWFAAGAAARLGGLGPTTVMVLLVALFFLVHYLSRARPRTRPRCSPSCSRRAPPCPASR